MVRLGVGALTAGRARPAQNGSDAPFVISVVKRERRTSEKKTNVFHFPKKKESYTWH